MNIQFLDEAQSEFLDELRRLRTDKQQFGAHGHPLGSFVREHNETLFCILREESPRIAS